TTTGNEATVIDAAAGSTIAVSCLNVADNLALASGKQLVLAAPQLNLAGSGKLNLADEELIATKSLSTVQSCITSGQFYTSSSGGGLGSLDLGGGQTEVRFTLLGDTNLDRRVDVTDLGNLASNYGAMYSGAWVS